MDGHTAAFEGRAGGLSGIDAQQFAELKPTFERIARLALGYPGITRGDVVIMAPDGSLHGLAPYPMLPPDREQTFTWMTVSQEGCLWVEDARNDPRFVGHPMVSGPESVRFCAGAAIRLLDGQAVGAVIVSSQSPLAHDPEVAAALLDLARQGIQALNQRHPATAGDPARFLLLHRHRVFNTVDHQDRYDGALLQ